MLVIRHSRATYLCCATCRHLLRWDRTTVFCSLLCSASNTQRCGTRISEFACFLHRRAWGKKDKREISPRRQSSWRTETDDGVKIVFVKHYGMWKCQKHSRHQKHKIIISMAHDVADARKRLRGYHRAPWQVMYLQ